MVQGDKFVLTLDIVKGCIGFDPNSGLYKSLIQLVDIWYLIAKKDGKSEDDSIWYAFDKLSEKMLSF